MKKKPKSRFRKSYQITRSIFYFFPIQLLFVHLKKNLQLVLFWLIFFLIIFNQIGNKYGIPLLFLAPEYLGQLSFSSYFITGFSIGGFITAFNISSYIMNGFRFPFLATLSKPFLKYCMNNSLIPIAFIITYCIQSYKFLIDNEALSRADSFYRIFGFLGGVFIFLLLSALYFAFTNKDLEKLFGKEITKKTKSKRKEAKPAKDLLSKTEHWFDRPIDDRKVWKVSYYIGSFFKIKRSRPFEHYDRNMLNQVFRQNQINASIFEIIVIVSILTLGLFRDWDKFIIPAAATAILVFTMLLMVSSALRSWLRGWTFIVIAGVLIVLNSVSKYNDFYYESRAYGLSYDSIVDYSRTEDAYFIEEEDKRIHRDMLHNWKNKSRQKPKAIFIASSGGGSKAMYWSLLALQHLDSLSQGELFKHSVLIAGSSGGMIGSAYFRELKHRNFHDSTINPYDFKYGQDLSSDILNPMIFTLAVNDMLIRTQRFEYDGEKYWKDRAYTFERILNKHTRGFLDKKLRDYLEAEKNADIPLMIFSPSIVNDGRRMLISSLPISFMKETELQIDHLGENVEYQSLFNKNNPLNTRFLSILRMSASFPYIMTSVNLPTDPRIEVFDAGLRDNYGIKTIVKYIYNMKPWLEENTSGIIILQIRDGLKRKTQKQGSQKQSLAERLLTPFGSLYGNWFQVQDYNNDELIEYASDWYSGSLELINYQLKSQDDEPISLSWHLTTKEKNNILYSLKDPENIEAEKKLLQLLEVK